MDLPTPQHAVVALAAFVRHRLSEVGDTLAPLWIRNDGGEFAPLGAGQDGGTLGAARQLAMVIVGAAGPFAATSYARARLLRQMHASGLLSEREAERAVRISARRNGDAG